jgi:hypothetical protein
MTMKRFRTNSIAASALHIKSRSTSNLYIHPVMIVGILSCVCYICNLGSIHERIHG